MTPSASEDNAVVLTGTSFEHFSVLARFIPDLAQFVIMAGHVLFTSCSGSAALAHRVPLFHLVPYTSAGFIPPRCGVLLPTQVPPITAVSQEAVDGTSELTALLFLIFSLSSAAQTTRLHSSESGDLRLSHF